MSDEPDLDLDLDAWPAHEPSPDFAERVLARVLAEHPAAPSHGASHDSARATSHDSARATSHDPARGGSSATPAGPTAPAPTPAAPRRLWRVGAFVGGGIALAAALAIVVGRGPARAGEAIANERLEVSIGSRARAVLEPGAQVRFDGDDVHQSHGDVFYRVEPGARFRVHTPAGDVEVLGTCFTVKIRNEEAMNKRDVRSAAVGAGLSALAFVAVYEGKVAVSHASQHVDVAAGESVQLGPDGARVTGSIADGERALAAQPAASASEGSPLAQANDNLVAQVSEYRARLELIATQKSDLEQKLKVTEQKLAADGGPVRTRPEFDLSTDDWAELAKKGEVKFRRPCFQQDAWSFSPEMLNRLGLAPQDAAPLRDAYQRSYERLWTQIRPLCAAALGTTGDVVDKIGPDSCVHLVYDLAKQTDSTAASEAHTQAAEIRAGLRPEPPVNQQHAVLKLFLLLTGANKAFESDLAKTFGPEEAYRLANADGMCSGSSRWSGGVIRGANGANGAR